jgi:hypothetical protein
MSRAMNVSLPEAQVQTMCETAKVRISAIETLPDGGTHLVCVTSEGADEMRHRLRKSIITGRVQRFAFYSPARPPTNNSRRA